MTVPTRQADPCRVRLRLILPFLVALPLFAGCSGADAARAQLLLQQAQDAQKAVSSESFSAHVTVTADGQTVNVGLSGGGYLKGNRAGDMVVDVKVSAPIALPYDSVRVAKVGRTAWMEMNGKRTDFPASAGTATSTNALGALDFTRYVKDVKVQGGQVLGGKPVTKIVGVLDTASLLQGIAKLGSFAGGSPVPNAEGKVGDTRVVIFVDDTTHLIVAALADLAFTGATGAVKMHLDLAISGVGSPVAALPAA
jgi:hypothetical protein